MIRLLAFHIADAAMLTRCHDAVLPLRLYVIDFHLYRATLDYFLLLLFRFFFISPLSPLSLPAIFRCCRCYAFGI